MGSANLRFECSLQGIKIHFREFLYDFALKRNKLPGLPGLYLITESKQQHCYGRLFQKLKFWNSLRGNKILYILMGERV